MYKPELILTSGIKLLYTVPDSYKSFEADLFFWSRVLNISIQACVFSVPPLGTQESCRNLSVLRWVIFRIGL